MLLWQYRIIGMCGLRSNFASKFVGKAAGILTYFKGFAANLGVKGQARRTFDDCAVLPYIPLERET